MCPGRNSSERVAGSVLGEEQNGGRGDEWSSLHVSRCHGCYRPGPALHRYLLPGRVVLGRGMGNTARLHSQ